MTEEEWLGNGRPGPMLLFLSDRASPRQVRLFACACCRAVFWNLMTDPRSRNAVAVAERFADGQATRAQLYAAKNAALRVVLKLPGSETSPPKRAAWSAVYAAADGCTVLEPANAAERRAQGDLLRDVFGNPFRPVLLGPALLAWGDGIAVRLARAIYDERAFERMPILGDALEEAGCVDAAVLEHCRRPAGHARGCWALDALLGKRHAAPVPV